ncbi:MULTISPECIES: TolC family protein [Burkholderiaceae]|uniref:Type I secretion system, outer membrane component LapE / AggA n=1 Tax=Caballeronia sordidicola TaxID=196367 RepID=A0A242MNP1_CABSO|nr:MULTISPECIES: TolC family protein [Burkholderiaceae]AME23889.1 hypothetical protein AXG89_08545 [Burkholderia sp. PAMC 26561]OTP72939.1 Type I secretion system, outer membrane component LapE / AggA [Caballeronia sordidicola]
MSNTTRIARPDRGEEKLIKDVYRRRPLVSSFGVLVGSGVVAMAALPSVAKAKSALDDMAWLPQNAQLSNGAATVPRAIVASPLRTISASPNGGNELAPVAHTAQPVQPAVTRIIAPAAPVNAAPRPRGFADMGFAPTVPVQAAVSAPVAQRPVQIARQQVVVGVSASPIRPSLAENPAHDMQADLQAMRAEMARSAATAQEPVIVAPSKTMLAAPSALPPMRVEDIKPGPAPAGLDADTPAEVKGQRKTRNADRGYADWLDDKEGAKAQVDRSVVPEQAVRSALRGAVDTAAERNAAIRQARNDWEAAKYDVDQVKGQRWPQVQVGGNSPALTGSHTTFDDSNRASANVSVTTMVYDWGKTSKNIASRSKTAEAAEFYLKTIEQQNAYDVSSTLVDLAKYRAVYAAGDSYVKRMSALVDMLVEITKVDPGRLSELSQARARLLQAQTSQDTVAAQVRSLELNARKLVGDQETAMPHGTRWQLRLDPLDSAVAAVAQNPAIEQATAEAAAASLTAKSVRAASLPQLNWVINKTTAHDSFNNVQPWTTMLQLTWTPFQGGSQRAAERAALSRAASSSDKRDQLQLDSEFRVRDAHRDAIALATRAQLYAQLSTETDLVRKQFFEQWYHLNRRTLVDVLLAEADFYNNQVSEVTTQFDAYQAILKIHLNNGTLNQWLIDGAS